MQTVRQNPRQRVVQPRQATITSSTVQQAETDTRFDVQVTDANMFVNVYLRCVLD